MNLKMKLTMLFRQMQFFRRTTKTRKRGAWITKKERTWRKRYLFFPFSVFFSLSWGFYTNASAIFSKITCTYFQCQHFNVEHLKIHILIRRFRNYSITFIYDLRKCAIKLSAQCFISDMVICRSGKRRRTQKTGRWEAAKNWSGAK